jgi:hypothetical protein
VRKNCYKGQDTIVYDSNLDRVPWVVSTVSCPQDSASRLPLAVLLINSSYLLKVSCCFCPIINVVNFSAIRLNTGIFLDWPIREILSLCLLLFAQSYKSVIVLLFCPVPVSLLPGTNRYGKHRRSLFYVSFCILMLPPRGMVLFY